MPYIWALSLTAALGGLLFGYDWVVIGGAKPFYEAFFNLTTSFEIGWAMSSALVGCLVGALLSGGPADRFGRKRLLILAAALFTISAVGTALARRFSGFVWYRLLGGVGIGLASNLSPMYIAEISPAEMRGKFVSINQLTIVIGILAAQTANWLIAQPVPAGASAEEILQSWNGQYGWRWMFGAETLPAACFLLAMFLVPESPRWQVKNGRYDSALRTLAKIGGDDFAQQSMREIQATLAGENRRVNYRELLQPPLLRVLTIGVTLAVFQQWCGINVIFNYAEEVFAAAGYGVSDILFNIVITGTINLLFTFIAIRTVDRWGRKPLLIVGAGGLSILYVLLGAGYRLHLTGPLMLLLVVAAIACYAMSLAPVVWVVISEIFPNRIRGAAMAVSVSALWIACFVLTYTFPYLNRAFGASGTFWIYTAVCVGGFFFILHKVPETKGKSLEEIETALMRS
ncbi:MAG: sugar porter family MFS transporter [candidate division KSB1 bacterium]|nr:sugar porter family MFS transporter [candidate division KSB1 bacterium]MDZ7346538.1 sugar porter family MFS transporter [candidate division KSB1 bacterium]